MQVLAPANADRQAELTQGYINGSLNGTSVGLFLLNVGWCSSYVIFQVANIANKIFSDNNDEDILSSFKENMVDPQTFFTISAGCIATSALIGGAYGVWRVVRIKPKEHSEIVIPTDRSDAASPISRAGESLLISRQPNTRKNIDNP